jgi:hypothetical protein
MEIIKNLNFEVWKIVIHRLKPVIIYSAYCDSAFRQADSACNRANIIKPKGTKQLNTLIGVFSIQDKNFFYIHNMPENDDNFENLIENLEKLISKKIHNK